MNITLPGKAASLMASQRERAEKQRAELGVEARSWYRITNAASEDEAEVMLYDEVGGWFGATADQFIADLRGVTAPNLRVRINSPGGSVFEGIAIANALRSHPANVTVQVDGIAASIASVIAMAGDRIEMAPNTMLMIHDASGVCLGNAADMEEMAELLDLISDNIADAYASRAGGTRDEWRARMRSETWYLPEDAVENGLADEAITAPKAGEPAPEPASGDDEYEMRKQFDLTAYGYQGPWAKPEPQPPTLTISLAEALDEQTVETLCAMVRSRRATASVSEPASEPAPAPEHPVEEPAAEPEARAETPEPPATVWPEPPAEPEPDEWAAMVAHLTQDDADTWSALVSNLIEPDTSSSAATA